MPPAGNACEYARCIVVLRRICTTLHRGTAANMHDVARGTVENMHVARRIAALCGNARIVHMELWKGCGGGGDACTLALTVFSPFAHGRHAFSHCVHF